MKIGDTVLSSTYEEKGAGTVLMTREVFGQEYADIFFEGTREKLTLPVSDLSGVRTPEEKFRTGEFSPASKFMLRLLKDHILAAAAQEGLQAAGNFKILPLPHQLLAVNFVLDQFKPRAMIADEVGLGKTIEAALVYEELKARGIAKRVLIIAPSGLCGQWRDELKVKFSEEFALYDRDTVRSLKKMHGEETNVWKLADRVITSMDFIKPKKLGDDLSERTLRNRSWHNKHVFEASVEAGFDVVIIDEAHKLTKDFSGEETARYKVGKELSEAVPIFLLLSATPHQGDSAKFRNLLHLIDPYLFYKGCELKPENVLKVTVRNNKRAAVDFSGNRLFKQRITSLCKIDRHSQEDEIELELYEKVTEYVSEYYDLAERVNNRTLMFLLLIYQRMVSSSSRAILNALSRRLNVLENEKRTLEETGGEAESENSGETQNEIDIENLEDLTAEEQLEALEKAGSPENIPTKSKYIDYEILNLKNIITLAKEASTGRNDAKFRKLLEIIDEFIIRENNPKLKFIIFTEFVETQKYIDECLKSLGYKTALINGKMSPDEKLLEKLKFQNEAQFLISTDAGGEGINLQFCWVMVNYDMPWNPMRLEQRIGRIDRIGQEHDVKIVNFQLEDTVEQRVREVIETKLGTIKIEFNDGEDKLADILSTLQDEFSFEKIYIDAVKKRELGLENLNILAEQIYLRAKEIINNGDITLPFSGLEEKYSISKHELEKQNILVQSLIEAYLTENGGNLAPYKTKEHIYYFEDPLSGKRITNVIFDQKASVESENCELFSFSHPYVKNLIQHMDKNLKNATTARLQVHEGKFAGESGFIFVHSLSITNNIDSPKKYLIPVFINSSLKHNNRISQYFSDPSKIKASELIAGKLNFAFDAVEEVAQKTLEQKAEEIYYECASSQNERLTEIENKMKKYFRDKEESINRIAVENIKQAKLRELNRDIENNRAELQQRKMLVPSFKCEQIAYVEFV